MEQDRHRNHRSALSANLPLTSAGPDGSTFTPSCRRGGERSPCTNFCEAQQWPRTTARPCRSRLPGSHWVSTQCYQAVPGERSQAGTPSAWWFHSMLLSRQSCCFQLYFFFKKWVIPGPAPHSAEHIQHPPDFTQLSWLQFRELWCLFIAPQGKERYGWLNFMLRAIHWSPVTIRMEFQYQADELVFSPNFCLKYQLLVTCQQQDVGSDGSLVQSTCNSRISGL